MSRDNSQTKLINSKNDEDKFDKSKHKSWTSDSNINTYQNQTCCSPVDEIEQLEKEDKNLNIVHSMGVETDKSTIFLLQDKKLDKNKKNIIQVVNNEEILNERQTNYTDTSNLKYHKKNEFENLKQTEPCENDKMQELLPININNSEMFKDGNETDLDQSLDYALCYNETNVDEQKKDNTSFLYKNDFLNIEETIEDKNQTIKPKGFMNKEPTRNKKEMFSNTSRSFKEIFNFFKDRDKKRSSVENTKLSTLEGSKILKNAEIYEHKIEKLSELSVEQYEKEKKSKIETLCSQQSSVMFSRSSSVGSLNGLEQNSINDDHSPVVSDVTYRTSGKESPSEVPDSPAHTAPAGFRFQQKCQIGIFIKKKIQPQQDKSKINYQCSAVLNDNGILQNENTYKKLPIVKESVFEDNLTSFKDESTPKLHSVSASSLSSLTIDDDDEYDAINKLIFNKEKQNIIEKTKVQNNRQEPIGESNHLVISLIKSKTISDEADEDFNNEQDDELTDLTSHEEQLLDQCIRRGIAKWTKQNINKIEPFSWDVGLTCRATRAMLISRIRLNSNINLYNHTEEKESSERNKININSKFKFEQKIQDEIEDNTYDLCSNKDSDSLQSQENIDTFDQNSYYICYEEHLLDQCIRKGMAKITKRNINDIKPFSWDAHHICLTTRAMMFRSHDGDFCGK